MPRRRLLFILILLAIICRLPSRINLWSKDAQKVTLDLLNLRLFFQVLVDVTNLEILLQVGPLLKWLVTALIHDCLLLQFHLHIFKVLV